MNWKALTGALIATLTSVAASAADMPMRGAPPIISSAPPFTWTGFYLGLNAGYAWGVHAQDTVLYSPATGTFFGDGGARVRSGFAGGGQAGYNYQMGAFVLGAETDVQYWNSGGNQRNLGAAGIVGGGALAGIGCLGIVLNCGAGGSSSAWFGTTRARAGLAIDRVMLYATGGLAYGSVQQTGQYFGWTNSSGTKVGWAAGGGVEYAFSDHWSVKTEALWLGFPTNTRSLNALAAIGVFPLRNGAASDVAVVRSGVNYKF